MLGLFRAHHPRDLGILFLEKRRGGGIGEGRLVLKAADFFGDHFGMLEDDVLVIRLGIERRLVAGDGGRRHHPDRVPRTITTRREIKNLLPILQPYCLKVRPVDGRIENRDDGQGFNKWRLVRM